MATHEAVKTIESLIFAHAYPHAIEGDVRVIETHISWVLLAGNFAYKIKKPTKNSFLDYTTLALRKHYCEEELRLNQRFAPDLYLGTVPITEHNGHLCIEGPGEPIEYAVKMKRFPDRSLLSDRLAQGLVTINDVRQLASRIAEFHQCTKQAEPSSRFGSPDLVYAEALDNFREIRIATVDRFANRLALLEDWTKSHFASHTDMFQLRKLGGHIRECHGDLHLGNIVEWEGRLIPFDGIEFCEEFRWIDTLSDALFTAMDFAARGRTDYCRSFANMYFEATGDYDAIHVLQWYLVYRAMVRAKVAAMRISQTEPNSPEHAVAESELNTQLSLANQQAASHSCQPRLWITYGVSGSGKTTGSEQVLQRHGAIRIRADVERKRLAGLKPNDRLADNDERVAALYSNEMNLRTYQRLAELTDQILRSGTSLIIDATFLLKRQRTLFRDLADRLQVPFHILAFHADPAILRERIEKRLVNNQDASDADLSVLQSQLEHQNPLDPDELGLTVSCEE